MPESSLSRLPDSSPGTECPDGGFPSEIPPAEPFPQQDAPFGASGSNDKSKATMSLDGQNPTFSISGPVNLTISYHEPIRRSKKRKMAETTPEDVDGVLEHITGKFDGLMRNIPNTYERVPNAATMMNCSLPPIQHQGVYPEDEWLVYPIDTYREAPFPNDIDCVKYIYRDRLAAREHIDWECRRLCLRLMRLRELRALEEKYNDLIESKPSPDGAFLGFKDPSWYKANNKDEDLIKKIRKLELRIQETQEKDDLEGSQGSSVTSSSKSND